MQKKLKLGVHVDDPDVKPQSQVVEPQSQVVEPQSSVVELPVASSQLYKKIPLNNVRNQFLGKNRFEITVISNLRDIVGNALQIIDMQYNKRYLYTYGKKFNLLIDSLNKTYYVLDMEGKDIDTDTDNRIISDFMLDFDLEFFDKDLFLSNNIEVYILDSVFGCFMHNNNKTIQDKLAYLNRRLQKKCPDMKLVFDNYYNLEGDLSILFDYKYDSYILCLYYNKNCISSILLKFIDNRFEINSNTNPHYGKNKYNKLLRCVLIIICYGFVCNDTILTYLESNPINPISSWLLISNFETIVTNNDGTVRKDFNTDTYEAKQQTKEILFTTKPRIFIYVPLNINNFTIADKLFDILVDLNGNEAEIITCAKPQPAILSSATSHQDNTLEPATTPRLQFVKPQAVELSAAAHQDNTLQPTVSSQSPILSGGSSYTYYKCKYLKYNSKNKKL